MTETLSGHDKMQRIELLGMHEMGRRGRAIISDILVSVHLGMAGGMACTYDDGDSWGIDLRSLFLVTYCARSTKHSFLCILRAFLDKRNKLVEVAKCSV